MNSKFTVFDIETGALEIEKLAPMLDELEYSGTAKTEEGIARGLETQRMNFIKNAALDPTTSRILAIGYLTETNKMMIDINADDNDEGEKRLLQTFWQTAKDPAVQFAGHNILSFDLPFIARRSWYHKIKPDLFWKGKPWDIADRVYDTMTEFGAGKFKDNYSLNAVARFFGLEGKTGTGDQFSVWFRSADRNKAIEYLEQDLKLTWAIAERMKG